MDYLFMDNNVVRVDDVLSAHKYPLMDFSVPAGFPSPARDYVEDVLNLNELMISHPAATYLIRAEGSSMVNANIRNGDILVVDRSLEATDNKVIIAIIDGEMTVKRLKIRNNGYWLCPENDKFKPMKVEEWMDFSVWGVVTWVIHKSA